MKIIIIIFVIFLTSYVLCFNSTTYEAEKISGEGGDVVKHKTFHEFTKQSKIANRRNDKKSENELPGTEKFNNKTGIEDREKNVTYLGELINRETVSFSKYVLMIGRRLGEVLVTKYDGEIVDCQIRLNSDPHFEGGALKKYYAIKSLRNKHLKSRNLDTNRIKQECMKFREENKPGLYILDYLHSQNKSNSSNNPPHYLDHSLNSSNYYYKHNSNKSNNLASKNVTSNDQIFKLPKTVHHNAKNSSEKIWNGTAVNRVNAPRGGRTRRFIYPGTLWCGAGNVSKGGDDQLGVHADLDRCCQAHDMCGYTIETWAYKYSYLNIGLYTISHCECDSNFRTCLRYLNSLQSNEIGDIFFNKLSMKCFILKQQQSCAERNWSGFCVKYTTKLVAEARKNAPYTIS